MKSSIRRWSCFLSGTLVVLAAACAPAMTATPAVDAGYRLPDAPRVRGDLAIEVVYPGEGASVATRDSTFVFGNTGRGDATLSINGASVDVADNGAWLAYLPVPPDGQYRLIAEANGQRTELVRTVRIPSARAPLSPSSLQIIEGSVTPRGMLTRVRGEQIEVSFRGTPGASGRLRLPDGTEIPLVERTAVDRRSGFMLQQSTADRDVAEYVGVFNLSNHLAGDPEIDIPTLTGPGYIEQRERQGDSYAVVELVRGSEVIQARVPASIGMVDPMRPRVAVAATSRPDSTVIGRRNPGSDQAWEFFWPNGTLLPIDAEVPGSYRVRLTPEITAWVSPDDVELLDPATPAPVGYVGPSIELEPQQDWIEVRFSMSDRLPFRVEPDEFGLGVEFYGATGRPAYVGYGEEDPFVDRLDWEQRTDDFFRFNIHLNGALWGYRYMWEGSTLVLHVRRPPVVDAGNPLRGMRIAVDAGHAGFEGDSGAVGPTGLTEVESTLKVARELTDLLRAQGAEVIEIRPDANIVPLIDRPVTAMAEDADLFLSIHFNAFPDGVNPFQNHGTTMFYFWPHSVEFARQMQSELVDEFGLPDRGVRFQNLAITRTFWMPSVLTETLFMMVPQLEASLRDPAVIRRIAEAHVRGIRGFLTEQTVATPRGN